VWGSASSRFAALALSTEAVSSSDACTYTSHFTDIADTIAVPVFSVSVASVMGTLLDPAGMPLAELYLSMEPS
jgi:hypothetical protein